jgi:putative heme-binding domain-containing protein
MVDAPTGELIPLEITLPFVVGKECGLAVAWNTSEDDTLRPLPLRRLFVPWASRKSPSSEQPPEIAALPKELEGGSWGRGRKIFFGEKANCGKCHRVGSEGGHIGPNLSNLIHRDYASVTRDILQPSFAINPDHLTQTILLADGRVLTGVVTTSEGQLLVGDKDGKQTKVNPSDVEEMKPSKVSIMPEGIAGQLGAEAMRDLLTFLLAAPPRMPRDLEGGPEPRSLKEVEKVLSGSAEIKERKPLNLVLVAGKKDHGPGEHDYPAWLKVWGQLFEAAENVEVAKVMEWPSDKQFADADAIVFYQKGTWDTERAADIDAFLARGGGVSYIHYAVDGGQDAEGFANRIGLAWGAGAKFRHGELDLIFDAKHPIARNYQRVHLHDESYWNLRGNAANITLLASAREENAMQPLVWCREQGKGRVFVSIPGHYSWTFDDPLFRILLLRGIAWSTREPVDRFNDLVPLGANLKEAP